MNVFNALFNPRVELVLASLAIVFFGGCTVYCAAHPSRRVYVPGLLLIDFGILNAIGRDVFFPYLSYHPTSPGGIWRFATAAIVVWGWMLVERTRRAERAKQQT